MYCGAKPKLAMVAVKACETSGLFITPYAEQLIKPSSYIPISALNASANSDLGNIIALIFYRSVGH
jgi:hypothetical protein